MARPSDPEGDWESMPRPSGRVAGACERQEGDPPRHQEIPRRGFNRSLSRILVMILLFLFLFLFIIIVIAPVLLPVGIIVILSMRAPSQARPAAR